MWKGLVLAVGIVVGLAGLLQTELPDAAAAAAMFASGDAHFVSEDIVAPRAAGFTLQFLARVVNAPVVGPVLTQMLYQQNKIHHVRAYATTVQRWPLFYPVQAVDAAEVEQRKELAKGGSVGVKAGEGTYKRWTVSDYHAAFKTKKRTPVEVAEAVYAAIRASSGPGKLNGFLAVGEAAAMREARSSAERWAKGAPIGPFDGVPIAVKTEMDVTGFNTTLGTVFLHEANGFPATGDATPVARLRAAGAVIVGVTTMHEIGCGTTGHNAHVGANLTRNPWNLAHYTGGSSSGSAAVVGAGIVPVAVGADGGGSIRIPSALCGAVGLKATFGRVPCDTDLDWSVGHVGPIAATVRDAALAYELMAGPDAAAMPPSTEQPPAHTAGFSSHADLSDVALCVMPDYSAVASAVQHEAYLSVLEGLKKRGAAVREVVLPQLEVMKVAHGVTILSEMATKMDAHHVNRSLLSAEVQSSLAVARHFSARDYLSAQKVRAGLMPRYRALFRAGGGGCDALVTPTTATTAPLMQPDAEVGGESDIAQTARLMTYVILGNFLGFPGLAVPTGVHDQANLPTSVQIYADHWDEHVLLRLGRAVEEGARSQAVPQAHHPPLPQ